MKKHLRFGALLALFVLGIGTLRADGPIQVLQINATGTNAGNFGQTNLTLGTGQFMSVDANGSPVAITPVVYAPLPRTGTVALTIAGGLTKTVTFTNPMPSASYSIGFSTSGVTAALISWSNKTATGFTINLSAASVGSIDYTCNQQTSATQ